MSGNFQIRRPSRADWPQILNILETANFDLVVDGCFLGGIAGTPEKIVLPSGTHTISILGNDDTNAGGDFDILDDVNIGSWIINCIMHCMTIQTIHTIMCAICMTIST